MLRQLSDDVRQLKEALNVETGILKGRAEVYAAKGWEAEAAYCHQLRRQLWQLVDALDDDARANGILPNGVE